MKREVEAEVGTCPEYGAHSVASHGDGLDFESFDWPLRSWDLH